MKKYINLSFCGEIGSEYTELKCKMKDFSCKEFEFSIEESVECDDVTIFQTFHVGSFNDELIRLYLVCDVLNKNNVKSISYFAPFLPYTRQDRTYNASVSLGSKMVAEIINRSGISELTTYDLHALQIECFFECKVNNLSAIPLFLADIKKKFDKNAVIVFPDTGAASRFKRFFRNDDFEIAIIRKTRMENGDLKMQILGNVADQTAILLDDMIDSGGTLIEASKILISHNANEVFAYATHGVFSGDGFQNLNNSVIKNITTTNSLDCQKEGKFSVIKIC